MLEYWVGWNEIYLIKIVRIKKLKSEHHPLFIPNIPSFHSILNDRFHTTWMEIERRPFGHRYFLDGLTTIWIGVNLE